MLNEKSNKFGKHPILYPACRLLDETQLPILMVV